MRRLTIAALGSLVFGIGGTAYAQTSTTSDTEPSQGAVQMRAPRRAFEIGVDGGYTQPFGALTENTEMTDVASAGGAVGLTLGYRATPFWSFAVAGQFHDSASGDRTADSTDVRGLTAGLEGTFHMLPFMWLDPFLTLGAGYRALWIAPEGAPNATLHAVQALHGVLGLDARVAPSVALGPRIGADLDVFVAGNETGTGNVEVIDNPRLSTFIYAGLGGRFDIGGQRVPTEPVAVPAAAVIEKKPPPPPPAAPPPPPAQPEMPLTVTVVNIDADIISACGINKPKAYFDFDSAKLKDSDLSMLDAVGVCFTTGPLAGREVLLLGRADPRGTDQYNEKLGKSRAQTVSDYLGGRGIRVTQMSVVTRGEADAEGTDELSWAEDRRVDLRLVK